MMSYQKENAHAERGTAAACCAKMAQKLDASNKNQTISNYNKVFLWGEGARRSRESDAFSGALFGGELNPIKPD